MNKIFSFFKSISQFLALPILSGILVGTSYIPFNGWALLFCYIPLWIKILSLLRENKSLFQVFMAGWVSQFILTLIGFNWIYYVSAEFGHLPWFLSAGALFLYAAFMHIYIPLALVVAAKIIRRFQIQSELIQFIFIAICAGLLERIWPSIFEWNLAYTLLWIKFPLYQWADTVGFWGLSTWIFIMQAGLAYVIIKFKSQRKEALLVFAHVAIALALLTALGYYKGKGWSKADQLVRIAVTQGNIGNAEKIQSEKKSQFHSYIRGIYTGLTENLMQTQPADLVIWPETAMPFAFDQKYLTATEQKKLLASANQWGITIVTGAYSLNTDEKDHLNDSIIRNSIFYISPNFSYAAFPYYKTNLLAFGEYMPFGEVFPFLYKILPFVGTYAKGSGPVVAEIALDKKTLKLGPQMCYDSLAPGFSRELSKNGAQVIFNVTNDSWFGWWAEPFQHQYMTLARAIEVRRPLVRSTNTGFSSAILADGTMLANSPMNQTWAHTYNINYKKNPSLTFYATYGHYDWVIWVLILLILVQLYRRKGEHV